MFRSTNINRSLLLGGIISAGSLAMVASAQSGLWKGRVGPAWEPVSVATQAPTNNHMLGQLGVGGYGGEHQSGGGNYGGGSPGEGLGGGGGLGSGGNGVSAPANPPIEWQKPESESDPIWLTGGKVSMLAMEENRLILAEEVAVDYQGTPLSDVLADLTEKTGVKFEANLQELDLIGVDIESPITLSSPPATVRELLRRTLDPLELTYKVTASTIEITSKDGADAEPWVRFYDMSFILPNSSNADTVTNAIQQTIDPDSWLAAGGTSTIVFVGSMMIISAPDSTHQHVEMFLINLARMNPKNAERAPQPSQLMGGGPGGMF